MCVCVCVCVCVIFRLEFFCVLLGSNVSHLIFTLCVFCLSLTDNSRPSFFARNEFFIYTSRWNVLFYLVISCSCLM